MPSPRRTSQTTPAKKPSSRSKTKKVATIRSGSTRKVAAMKSLKLPTQKKAPASTLRSSQSTQGLSASVKRPEQGMWRESVWMHIVVAGSAVAVLTLLGVIQSGIFSTHQSDAKEPMIAAIALDHEGRANIDILIARKGSAGYASITNRSPSALAISLPSEWKRTEVSGATLDEVTGAIPSFGFRTWHVPAGAGMKMQIPESPDALLLQNRSGDIAVGTVQGIDIVQETRTSATVLLQEESSLVKLWGE